jgi:peptide deformylase
MHRLFIYRVGADAPLVAVVNPRLEWSSEERDEAEEGCLSLPRVAVDVERPVHVRVSAQDEHGDPIVLEASGLEARVIQHEMDHLDGVLILERTTREQRREALRVLRGGEPQAPSAVGTGAPDAG